MSIFEIIMLVCFGAAWPSSIYKSYISRTSKGKSLFFLIIVFIGYVSGIIHKLLFHFDWVILLYMLNGCMIVIDAIFYIRNASLDRQRESVAFQEPDRLPMRSL
jgi:hypothetical protein